MAHAHVAVDSQVLCAPAFIRAGSAVQDVLRSDRCASSMQSCAESLTGGRIFNKTLATPHRCAAAGANPNACGRFLLGGEPAAGKAIEKVTLCTSTHPVRVRWCGCCFGAFESGLPRRAGAYWAVLITEFAGWSIGGPCVLNGFVCVFPCWRRSRRCFTGRRTT